MSWKKDKQRRESLYNEQEKAKQRTRDLHDAFWGRLKQPKEESKGGE